MPEKNHIYFASDLHLGMHPRRRAVSGKRYLFSGLRQIREDAKELWLLGDVFDYWFEYYRR